MAEQLIKKNWELSDTLKAVGITLGALLAMGISCVLLFTPVYVLIFPAFVGISYLAYRFITNLLVEFEYCIVDGELTVDKIINKSKRKKVVTVQVRNFELFEPYDMERISGESCAAYIRAAECAVPENGYYAAFNQPGIGRTILVFSPNEKMLARIKPYLRKTR